jgi:hypothetical protein
MVAVVRHIESLVVGILIEHADFDHGLSPLLYGRPRLWRHDSNVSGDAKAETPREPGGDKAVVKALIRRERFRCRGTLGREVEGPAAKRLLPEDASFLLRVTSSDP